MTSSDVAYLPGHDPVHLDPDDPLWTADDVARLLRTSVAALYAMRQRGTGPAAVRVGRRLLYRRSHVETWLADLEEEQARHLGLGA